MELDLQYDWGVVRTDEHYLATGHKIIEKVKIEKRWLSTDIIKNFECTQCNFLSISGKKIKI